MTFRRYLAEFDTRTTPGDSTDVLVIGGGIAGLRAAIEAGDRRDVLVVTKNAAHVSATERAQGGIAAAIEPSDTPRDHAADTLAAGAGLCDVSVVREVADEAPRHIRQLIDWGAKFDHADGELELGLEGGHGRSRIVHALGDATGAEMMRVLLARAAGMPRIHLEENTFAVDVVDDGARVVGTLLCGANGGLRFVRAGAVILAAGGAGHVYRNTTNPSVATGDGVALALRAGAVLHDVEMVQFHPTALVEGDQASALISEAVRGEGAHLVDRAGRRFAFDFDRRGELAPRDIVARAIAAHSENTPDHCAFLDVRHFAPGRFTQRFPGIDRALRASGIDPTTQLIPVRPAAHYMIGGAATDGDGRTSVAGLLACGEVASTGLHGANRLASNSLLEGLVFGRRAGALAAECAAAPPAHSRLASDSPHAAPGAVGLDAMRRHIQETMWECVGIRRDGQGLRRALGVLSEMLDDLGEARLHRVHEWETYDMLTAAWCIARGALERCESRGCHFRQDHPTPRDEWRAHVAMQRRADGELVVTRTALAAVR